ncbi:MAG: DUF1189 family protein [Candidatus Omnitrophota bacterium]
MFGLFGAFDPRFYPKISKQSIGRSIGFLALFVLIVAACVSARYTSVVLSGFTAAKKWVHGNIAAIASEYPAVTVEKGVIVDPKESFIKEYDKRFAVIIEPDPDKARAIMDRYPNLALLTQKLLIIKQAKDSSGAEEIKTYPMEKTSFSITPGESGFKLLYERRQFDLTSRTISRWLDIAGLFVFPVLLVICFAAYCFAKPAHVFIFSLASLIIAAIMKIKLSYKEMWNIGAYALVPSTCAAVLLDVSGFRVPFFWLLYCAIYIAYLYLGMKASAAASSPKN